MPKGKEKQHTLQAIKGDKLVAGRDGKQPKEGVDFEWVDSKTSNAKVRRFFTATEKKAMKDKKAPEAKKAAPKRASTPSKSPRPKSRPAQGGRGDEAAEVKRRKRDNYVSSGRGDGAAEVKRRKRDNYVSSRRGDGDTETFRRNFDRKMKETYGDKSAPKAKKAGGVTYSERTRSGMAKGGMVKANCGASMKPTQKRGK